MHDVRYDNIQREVFMIISKLFIDTVTDTLSR